MVSMDEKNFRKLMDNAIDKTLIEFDSSFHAYMKRFDSVLL
jgi:hypothetical protein